MVYLSYNQSLNTANGFEPQVITKLDTALPNSVANINLMRNLNLF